MSCQRVEVYSEGEQCGCGAPWHWRGTEALQHLCEVAAGLHSIVLGEEQILGQVRGALAGASPAVHSAGSAAIAAARRFRQENALDESTGFLLDRALAVSDTKASGPIVVVGAGSVGRLAAERARALGFGPITVVARRPPEGEWFQRGGMSFLPFSRMHAAGPADVLVTCLGSASPEIEAAQLPEVRRLIVDLGTPRNVAPGTLVPLVTIADLAASVADRASQPEWLALQGRLRVLLDERLAQAARDSRSHLGRVRVGVERVRQAELERIARLHPDLPADTMDTITRALVNQIFHLPTERLRAMRDPELGARFAELFAPSPGAAAGKFESEAPV